jgi:hypothetical protein
MNETLHTSLPNDYAEGDLVFVIVNTRDRRWWKRLMHFLLRREPPIVTTTNTRRVTAVTGTTMTIE